MAVSKKDLVNALKELEKRCIASGLGKEFAKDVKNFRLESMKKDIQLWKLPVVFHILMFMSANTCKKLVVERTLEDITRKKIDFGGLRTQIKGCTYTIKWSEEDQEFVGLCSEFPSLSWLAKTPDKAFKGIYKLTQEER